MKNKEIAQIFSQIADILEINDENPFRIRAYQNAARIVEGLPEEVEKIEQRGGIGEISGIGAGIADRISELVRTNRLSYYEELKAKTPEGLVRMLDIPDLGPKTVALLKQKLGIENIEQLEKAAREGILRNLPGMGEKTEENILSGIEFLKYHRERILLGKAYPLSQSIIILLNKISSVKRISAAGSLRRMRETIGDIDILATSEEPQQVMKVFTGMPSVTSVLAMGETKSSVYIEENIQIDLRVVAEESFGAALQYFTGSKSHNIKLRELAHKRGLKINEYGVFRISGERIGGREEDDIYKVLALHYIPPELREGLGEIEAAQQGRGLPELITHEKVRGDFHVHSNWSDGANSIPELAAAARRLGYEYLAICDHSKSLGIAGGLSEERLRKQIKEIKALNKSFSNFQILCGTEVDIDSDGELDFSDDLLSELDIVIAAIHTGFKQEGSRITERIISAMENKFVNIIAHPTGRLLGEREGYELDMERLIGEAKRTGTALELNALPQRLDLSDVHCHMAGSAGVLIALGTDAHNAAQLEVMQYGVATARRGWLEEKNVINTLSLSKLLKKLNNGKT
ncbi:DNA polymerase/3'-5' exonuclease PolX [candidate division NPL-UPA2 bacterium Unc8]|uniref:DNA-directed DNA polymerase n=1 Tax=candidate division NPL-UPA2 bacterium Unc8 TaxID=1980939 RepID=A0A399FZJ3_UNCN2|nr:DNA polymerase/3'-5' exonuclease PolX [Bacillota bacterium]MBT9137597.1 DNA polymerase/3'-5' exonuclease PolX [Bacillota bacterium]RII00682.1 MAG: DNA polymerase/3'-5' exonuclease PolX [candidate division NPL-UPA2 bacterium Unc8]